MQLLTCTAELKLWVSGFSSLSLLGSHCSLCWEGAGKSRTGRNGSVICVLGNILSTTGIVQGPWEFKLKNKMLLFLEQVEKQI